MADSRYDPELTTPRKLAKRLQTILGRQQSLASPSPFLHGPASPNKSPYLSDLRLNAPAAPNSPLTEKALSIFNQPKKEQLDSVKVAQLLKVNYIVGLINATRFRKAELLLREKDERLAQLTLIISEQKREVERLSEAVGNLHTVSIEQKNALDSFRLSQKIQQDLFNRTLQDNATEMERQRDVIGQGQQLLQKFIKNQFYDQLLADACFTVILMHFLYHPFPLRPISYDTSTHTIWRKLYKLGEKSLPLLLLMRFYLLLKRLTDHSVQISDGQLYSFLHMAGSTLVECKLVHGLVNRLLVL